MATVLKKCHCADQRRCKHSRVVWYRPELLAELPPEILAALRRYADAVKAADRARSKLVAVKARFPKIRPYQLERILRWI